MDVTVINDYTKDSMLRGCDEVIEKIKKLYDTQEVRKTPTRKTANDLLSELGSLRIAEGSARVENCELFNSKVESNYEK